MTIPGNFLRDNRFMTPLKKCPCGQIPNELHIEEHLSGKWINVYGSCCGEWIIETRNNYATGDDMLENATRAWNDSPRCFD
jgi:hypothetical protein